MYLLAPSDPLNPRNPDSAYVTEASTAEHLGIASRLIDFEALVYEQDAAKAVRRVAAQQVGETVLYRGWMLRPEQYAMLYSALDAKGVTLINDPRAYKYCHYLPEWYPALQEYTPRSVWLPIAEGFAIERIMDLLRPFGAAPVIVKDYVKSRKHEWAEACFIPSAADCEAVARVVGRFLALQGVDIAAGLVFREFVQFESIGRHSASGMPLTNEHRIFFLDGAPLLAFQYWEQGEYNDVAVPLEFFAGLAKKVKSRFFTMDVARRASGEWLIVELGDGQVAGLPDNLAAGEFYRALASRLL